jgi:Protein of unknown function (DUF2800)
MTLDLLRASSLYRDKNCLGNRLLSQRARAMSQAPPEENEHTLRGTRIHEGKPEGEDEEQARAKVIAEAYKVFDSLCDGEPFQVIAERELLLRHDGLIPYFIGHPDLFIATTNRIAFVDLKPGFECDWEAWKTQMDGYAALLFETYGSSFIQDVVGTVVTRFYGNREWRYSPSDCEKIINDIAELESSRVDKTTGGPWCKYCDARLICRDAIKFPVEAVDPVTESAVAIKTHSLPSGELGAEIVGKLKLIMKIARDRLAWYEEQLTKDPQFLAGKYVIGEGKEIRYVRAVVDAWERTGEAPNLLTMPIGKLEDWCSKNKRDIAEFSDCIATKTTKGSMKATNEIEDKQP